MTKSKYLRLKLTFSERNSLQELLSQDIPKVHICEILGISKRTIYREIYRCAGRYNAKEAQLNADEVQENKHKRNSTYHKDVKSRLDKLESRLDMLENVIKGK